jgi:hypothetical protein
LVSRAGGIGFSKLMSDARSSRPDALAGLREQEGAVPGLRIQTPYGRGVRHGASCSLWEGSAYRTPAVLRPRVRLLRRSLQLQLRRSLPLQGVQLRRLPRRSSEVPLRSRKASHQRAQFDRSDLEPLLSLDIHLGLDSVIEYAIDRLLEWRKVLFHDLEHAVDVDPEVLVGD